MFPEDYSGKNYIFDMEKGKEKRKNNFFLQCS